MPKQFALSNDALLILAELFTPKEIAHQLNLKPNTVSSKLYRLRHANKVRCRLRKQALRRFKRRNETIIQLKKATMLGPASIAKQLNLSKNTVIGVLYRERQRHNIVSRERRVNALSLTHFGN